MTADSDTSQQEKSGGEPEQPCCKVRRTAAGYGLLDTVENLPARRKEGDSFRTIATYFNTQVVSRVLSERDVTDSRSVHAALTSETLAEDVYEVLRAENDSDIRRVEVRARLSDAGVAVDELESAFVSHVTMRSHLQECVGVSPEDSPPPFEQTVNTTQGAKTRARNVIASTLDRAVQNEQLQTGPLETELLVQVSCQDCGDTFYLTELLERRHCSCSDTSGSGG